MQESRAGELASCEQQEEVERHIPTQEADRIRIRGHARAGLTVADLLEDWLATEHGWRPSTLAGNRSAAGYVSGDRLGSRVVTDVSPSVVRAVCAAWRDAGWKDPTIFARVRVLRSAISWAYSERILDMHPLDGMRSPPATGVRMHATLDQIRALLAHSQREVQEATADLDGSVPGWARLHRAEQVQLMTELAADSGARRGELAALQLTDLVGDVLTISRGTSNETVGPTKTNRVRRLTLSRTTAALWRDQVQVWRDRQGGDHFGPVADLGRTRSFDPADDRMLGTLVLRAVSRRGPSGRDVAPAAAFGGHVPGRTRRHPGCSIPPRSPRRRDHPADLQPRPADDRPLSRHHARAPPAPVACSTSAPRTPC